MKQRKPFTFFMALLTAMILALSMTGCSTDDSSTAEEGADATASADDTASTGEETQDAANDKAGESSTDSDAASGDAPSYIYLTNDPIGVNKFLESGKIGVENAAKQFGGTAKTFEGGDETTLRQNFEAAVQEAPDVIVAITFVLTDLALEYAKTYPDQTFVLVDDCPREEHPDNLYCAVFREHEAAYLIGYQAGLLSESNKTGSVGAVDIPFIHRYTDAFAQGASDANEKNEDSQLFIGGDNPFQDPARGKEQATAMFATGTDHIFAAASGSNGGVFEAAAENNGTAYGVDVNQCPDQPGAVGDGTLKLMDILIPDLIGKIREGNAEPLNSYGLKEGGMGIVSLHEGAKDSQCTVMEHPEVVEKLKEVRDKIVSGEITPKDATQ